VFFTSGTGIHEIDFVRYEVRPGNVYTLNPGQIHHWILSEDTEGFIFFHSVDFSLTANLQGGGFHPEVFPFFYSKQNKPEIILQAQMQREIAQLCEGLLQESRINEIFKRSKQHALVTLVYIALQRAYDPIGVKVSSGGYGSLLQRFERLVDKNFKDVKSPAAYAELLNITPKHLNRVSNEILDKTATEIITERVLLEAKKLLVSGNYNISEVANELGYIDYSYFTRLFKKNLGLSPREFMQTYGAGL
jgi:AraC-like DNA-binding protein